MACESTLEDERGDPQPKALRCASSPGLRRQTAAVLILGSFLASCAPDAGGEADSKENDDAYSWTEGSFVQHCNDPTYAELEALAYEWGKTPSGERAGLIVVEETTGGARNRAENECPHLYSWCPNDNALIIEYDEDVKLWHVSYTEKALESSHWFGKWNDMEHYSKEETMERFALPDCLGWPLESPNFGYPNPLPRPPNCTATSCDGFYSANTVVRYTGASIIPAGAKMAFGYVGPNMWGPGGELQWHVISVPQGKKLRPVDTAPWL